MTTASATMSTNLLANDPVLADIVRRLIDAYQPERIYLFGSQARGDAGPDSDYDLLIVVADNSSPERQSSRLAYEVLWGTQTAADVVVWPRSRFEGRRHVKASLPAIVSREGKLLHAGALTMKRRVRRTQIAAAQQDRATSVSTKKQGRNGNLAEFVAASPLRGSGLKLRRQKGLPPPIELE